jgi:peptidoglycan/LPS O-acetylase OafA/YrhL
MSIFFFLSGLFVWPSLSRKGGMTFLTDRLIRIGVPCILVVMLLMPIAYYPTYHVSAAAPSLAGYWKQFLALPFWPCGPQWFLWELIALNVLVAILHMIDPRIGVRLAALAAHGRDHPLRFVAGVIVLSAAAYVPLALTYTPWNWGHVGPVAWQLCRPLHYAVFFFAGMAIGAHGLERGLVATDGPLARHALKWAGAGVLGFFAWIIPTSFTVGPDPAPLWLQTIAGLGFVLGCAGGCFGMVALFLRYFARARRRFLDSLSANAYAMYLNHYVFVVWLQFGLLGAPLPGAVKALLVFAATLAVSWLLAAATPSYSPGWKSLLAPRQR